MKILFAGLTNHNYDSRQGMSFERETFLESMKSMPGIEVDYIAFDSIPKIGKRAWNQNLLEHVHSSHPDLLFAFMYSDEFDPAVLQKLKTLTTTVAWFSDDSWRFYNYSQVWAPFFSWCVTTYSYMPDLYRKAGQSNVIRSQWGVDADIFKPTFNSNIPAHDVSFVGTWSRPRGEVISFLKRQGINVATYGLGWKNSRRLSFDEMMSVFSTSKINLALNPPPGLWNMNSLGRLFFRPHINSIVPDFHFIKNFKTFIHRGVPQIKARHFEIPACGGFLLTSPADDISSWFEPGKEIDTYLTLPELAQKIRFYLAHEPQRSAIAFAARARTIRDHTYHRRFSEIFSVTNPSLWK